MWAEEEEFEVFLNEVSDFYIVDDTELARDLKIRFKDKIDISSGNIVFTTKDIGIELQKYVNKDDGMIIALIGKNYFKNKPLFMISIPKAGTHLLYELIEAFGYRKGNSDTEHCMGGYWYFTEFSNSHTSAKHFFNETVYKSDYGNRDHPFISSPALFIYRNPMDIVASEANYYHKGNKSAFRHYLSSLSYDERLMRLIDDKWLLGSIRDRVSEFIAWKYFSNVISLSFEELIGVNGGGSQTIQEKLVWSLQLKLQVPGIVQDFSKDIFNPKSDTFFKGQINSYKELFKQEHYDKFKELNQDFMEELGYEMNSEKIFSSKIDIFRNEKMVCEEELDFPPITKEMGYYGYNIVKYRKNFYAIPLSAGEVDIASDRLDSTIIVNKNINFLKKLILETKIQEFI